MEAQLEMASQNDLNNLCRSFRCVFSYEYRSQALYEKDTAGHYTLA
jgi:hypothetical protein